MRFKVLWVLFPFLAACSGGSTIHPSPSLAPAATTVGSYAGRTAQDNAPSPSFRQSAVRASADLLYVGNVGNNSITVYHHDANGNTSPLYVISGSKTMISQPGQLSEDAVGNLYVTNGYYGYFKRLSANPGILVFAHGAHGNVAPIRMLLAGTTTKFHNPEAMIVDQATGKIFVSDTLAVAEGPNDPCYGPSEDILLRFPPNATGHTAPFATVATACDPAFRFTSSSRAPRPPGYDPSVLVVRALPV
jgi:hypothetical protein